jgi:hypothetical protein
LSHRSPSAQVLTIMMTKIVGSAALRRVRGDRDADKFWDSRHRSCMTRSSLSVAERKYQGGPRRDIKRLKQHPHPNMSSADSRARAGDFIDMPMQTYS